MLSCSGLAGLNWASCGLWSAGHLELLVKVGHAHLLDSDWPWLPWGTVTRPLVPRPQQICPGSAQGQLPKASWGPAQGAKPADIWLELKSPTHLTTSFSHKMSPDSGDFS